jgi:hypothetical protein
MSHKATSDTNRIITICHVRANAKKRNADYVGCTITMIDIGSYGLCYLLTPQKD